jgi:hypothetical protein
MKIDWSAIAPRVERFSAAPGGDGLPWARVTKFFMTGVGRADRAGAVFPSGARRGLAPPEKCLRLIYSQDDAVVEKGIEILADELGKIWRWNLRRMMDGVSPFVSRHRGAAAPGLR